MKRCPLVRSYLNFESLQPPKNRAIKNILMGLFFLSNLAYAQEQKIIPSSKADFIGYWRIILIPDEFQKGTFKNSQMGYSAPCQFFVNYPDGSWLNTTVTNMAGAKESKDKCPKIKSELDVSLAFGDKSKFKWEQIREGYFHIHEASTKTASNPIGIVWKADKILAKTFFFGLTLGKGDLIMQIIKPVSQNRGEAIYAMVLRPLDN